jgi:hypothetical protein
MAIEFEKRITKDELTNKCIILSDDNGKDYTPEIVKGQSIDFVSGEKTFHAEVHEFFTNSGFKKGLMTPPNADGTNNFFFEKSLTQGKRLRIKFDGTMLYLEPFLVTK